MQLQAARNGRNLQAIKDRDKRKDGKLCKERTRLLIRSFLLHISNKYIYVKRLNLGNSYDHLLDVCILIPFYICSKIFDKIHIAHIINWH